MTLEEYRTRMASEPSWKPGRDVIQAAFERQYGHSGRLVTQANFRGTLGVLDGCGVYKMRTPYFHLVSFGLTAIMANEVAFQGRNSGWGFELTLQWPSADAAHMELSILLLDHIASRVETRKRSIRAMTWQTLDADSPIVDAYGASFRGVLFVEDADVPAMKTLHGNVRFLRVVNLVEAEVALLKKTPSLLTQLVFRMKQSNPDFVMEPNRINALLPV